MTKQEEFDEAVKANNIKNVKLLLKDKRVDPSKDFDPNVLFYVTARSMRRLSQNKNIPHNPKKRYPLGLSSLRGYIDIVKLLLKDKRIAPSKYNNFAIINAYKNNHKDIVDLLWKHKTVKQSLKIDDFELYNKIIMKEITKKISEF